MNGSMGLATLSKLQWKHYCVRYSRTTSSMMPSAVSTKRLQSADLFTAILSIDWASKLHQHRGPVTSGTCNTRLYPNIHAIIFKHVISLIPLVTSSSTKPGSKNVNSFPKWCLKVSQIYVGSEAELEPNIPQYADVLEIN